MRGTLGVPEGLLEPVSDFLSTQGIRLDLVEADDCTVQVAEANERTRCGRRRLCVGGFSACETARGMAAKLGIRVRQMGKLLDFLGIKVRSCSLGCFK